MENRQRELTAILESPGTYENPGLAMETNRELAGLGDSLEKANAEWMAAQAELQAKA
jgi:hypothetical protein